MQFYKNLVENLQRGKARMFVNIRVRGGGED